MLLRFVAYVWGLHGILAVPSLHWNPGGHARHVSLAEYWPAPHGRHAGEPTGVSGLAHRTGAASPPTHAYPAAHTAHGDALISSFVSPGGQYTQSEVFFLMVPPYAASHSPQPSPAYPGKHSHSCGPPAPLPTAEHIPAARPPKAQSFSRGPTGALGRRHHPLRHTWMFPSEFPTTKSSLPSPFRSANVGAAVFPTLIGPNC